MDFSNNPYLERREEGKFYYIYKIKHKYAMKDVVVDDKLELKYFMEKSDPF